MSQYKKWMVAFLSLLLLTFLRGESDVSAQQPPILSGDYEGPFISNPTAQSPAELKREIQIREKYCRTHTPGACIPDQDPRGPVNIDRGNPAPAEYGHLTVCHPDPNNPERPICVYK
jgi:hypothetical protein